LRRTLEGTENDRHGAYSDDARKNGGLRAKNEKLGPAAYGENVVMFSKAMKAAIRASRWE
jgi:hypothetical protein